MPHQTPLFAYAQHLHLEDGELHRYASDSWQRHLQMASRDLLLDLERRGICAGSLTSTGARAVVTLTLEHTASAEPSEPTVVPAGTLVFAERCQGASRLVYQLDSEAVVPLTGVAVAAMIARRGGGPGRGAGDGCRYGNDRPAGGGPRAGTRRRRRLPLRQRSPGGRRAAGRGEAQATGTV